MNYYKKKRNSQSEYFMPGSEKHDKLIIYVKQNGPWEGIKESTLVHWSDKWLFSSALNPRMTKHH